LGSGYVHFARGPRWPYRHLGDCGRASGVGERSEVYRVLQRLFSSEVLAASAPHRSQDATIRAALGPKPR